MPHPQDVAVPSLPRELNDMLSSELAQHVENYARAAVIADRAAGRASAEPEGFVPLTDAQIEKLREETFSTNNPFCPVDSKSMRKAVRAAERAHRLAAAPTPTASIAPKAEGEAELARGEVPSFESWWESWPFQAYKNELTKAAAHHAYRAGKAIGEGLTDCQNCLGDGKDGDVDDYGRMVGFDCHQCNGTGKVLRAAPVAQAATGAEDLRYEVLESKVRDLLHLLSFADIKTPSEGDAEQAAWVMANIRGFINGARPEADADRASGGGV